MKIYIIWFAWLGLFLRKLSIQKKVAPNNSYHCEIVILINLIMTGIIPTAQSDCESDLDLDLDFRFIDLHWFAFCYLFIALLLLSLKFNCCLVVVVVVAVVVAILFVLSLAVFFTLPRKLLHLAPGPYTNSMGERELSSLLYRDNIFLKHGDRKRLQLELDYKAAEQLQVEGEGDCNGYGENDSDVENGHPSKMLKAMSDPLTAALIPHLLEAWCLAWGNRNHPRFRCLDSSQHINYYFFAVIPTNYQVILFDIFSDILFYFKFLSILLYIGYIYI